MTKTNSDESLQAPLRLLIDEIVDALSQSGSGCECWPVQKPSPSVDAVGPGPGSRRRRSRQFSGLNNDLKKFHVSALLSGISSFY
jgi:hypothetical protein